MNRKLVKCITGKTIYPKKNAAQRAAIDQSFRSGEAIQAYQCRTCQKWHLGHPEKGFKGAKLGPSAVGSAIEGWARFYREAR